MQRKKPRTGMPRIFSNNDDGNFRLLARSTSIRSLSYHLTRNCLGIGGSKARVFSNFSFAKQRTKIFGSQRRANFSPTPTQQTLEPATSTWGDKGHLEVCLSPSNS